MAENNIINLINKTPDKPANYILHGENGDLLIDTGHKLCKEAVEKFARQYDVKWIFLTHGHFDHVWNAAYLKEKYGYKIILHEKDRRLYEENRNEELFALRAKSKLRVAFANTLIKRFHAPVGEVDYYLTDSDTDFLRKLGFDVDVIMLPGHTAGSMGIVDGDILYAGDACSSIRGHYKTVYLGTDPKAVRESEKKIRSMKPEYICAGHGSPIYFPDEPQ